MCGVRLSPELLRKCRCSCNMAHYCRNACRHNHWEAHAPVCCWARRNAGAHLGWTFGEEDFLLADKLVQIHDVTGVWVPWFGTYYHLQRVLDASHDKFERMVYDMSSDHDVLPCGHWCDDPDPTCSKCRGYYQLWSKVLHVRQVLGFSPDTKLHIQTAAPGHQHTRDQLMQPM